MKPLFIQNLISSDLCKLLAHEFSLLHSNLKLMGGDVKEKNFDNAFSYYSPLGFEALSILLQDKIESIVDCKVWPTYSYGRIYWKNSQLSKHKDRRSSEITLSICLKKDQVDWPLVIEHQQQEYSFNLELGDAVIYSGRNDWHWRIESFQGTEQIQAFLQYVKQTGNNSDLKYDGRPLLGQPYNTIKAEILSEITKELRENS